MNSKSSWSRFYSIVLLMALGAGLSSCGFPKGDVELRHLHPILVSSKQTGERTVLHLEGWVPMSQGGIDKITSDYSKDELWVRIELGLRDGLSPEIDFKTLVPAGVKRVVLGRERVPVWDRTHGLLVKPKQVKPSP